MTDLSSSATHQERQSRRREMGKVLNFRGHWQLRDKTLTSKREAGKTTRKTGYDENQIQAGQVDTQTCSVSTSPFLHGHFVGVSF